MLEYNLPENHHSPRLAGDVIVKIQAAATLHHAVCARPANGCFELGRILVLQLWHWAGCLRPR